MGNKRTEFKLKKKRRANSEILNYARDIKRLKISHADELSKNVTNTNSIQPNEKDAGTYNDFAVNVPSCPDLVDDLQNEKVAGTNDFPVNVPSCSDSVDDLPNEKDAGTNNFPVNLSSCSDLVDDLPKEKDAGTNNDFAVNVPSGPDLVDDLPKEKDAGTNNDFAVNVPSGPDLVDDLPKEKDAGTNNDFAVNVPSGPDLVDDLPNEKDTGTNDFPVNMPSCSNLVDDLVPMEDTDSDHELTVEPKNDDIEFTVEGNRIVDFAYIYRQLLEISNHNSALGCNLSCLKMIKEIKKGFLSKFCFTCRMCNVKFELKNCKDPDCPAELNINDNAVSSFMSIGAGYSGLEQVSASLDIPCMSNTMYAKCHKKVCELWELAKEKSMEEAAKEEYELAVQNGEVDANGVPMITVVADACWSKRSYRRNYSALSGAAVIIGYRTKKVIYMAVKNKYCMVCARAENKNKSIPDHICFKNYTGSSSGMESTALAEGFKASVATQGLIYSKLIADGDSSTYSKIEKAKPYGNLVVEKIECTNHLLRNYTTKLDDLTKNTRYPLKYRKAVQNNVMRLRRSVTGAVSHVKGQDNQSFQQKVVELKQDLLNAPHHVFGDHSSCKSYYCKKQSTKDASSEENLVPGMKSTEGGFIFAEIMKITYRLVNNATSLVHNVNSNIAEIFNSVIAKFIGGKRINYSTRQSYGGRCAASVVSFNSGQPQTFLCKKVFLRSPNKCVKRLENRRNIQRLALARRRLNKTFTVKPQSSKTDKNYGDSCEKPDLSDTDFEFAKNEHLKNITLSDEERHALERRTILQGESVEWRQERKLRLTASIFGRVCKRGLIKCAPLVKDIVNGKNLDHVKSIQYGRTCEHLARNQLETILQKPIKLCGLFIDKDSPFLGASPDGLVEEDKIVEIKCPYSAKGMSVDDAIKKKKITFWKMEKDGTMKLNKNHNWYFQAQGQINIPRRKTCVFAVWTDVDMKIEIIEEDKELWNDMEKKLKKFYFDCLLPEIIDSRLDRQMEIKEPEYILEGIKKREMNKKRKVVEEED